MFKLLLPFDQEDKILDEIRVESCPGLQFSLCAHHTFKFHKGKSTVEYSKKKQLQQKHLLMGNYKEVKH